MLYRLWKVCVAALATMATAASGHGYLAVPAARNVQHNSDYCPQCLNAGGPWTVYSRGHPARYGACGDPWNGPKHHERGGKYATPVRVAARYRAGQTFTARVVLTANHYGRWSLRLCPDASRAVYGTTCFKHLLARADGKGPYVPVLGSRNAYSVRFRLPRGVRCKNCVMRWYYETGNSCSPPGMNRPGLDSCARSTNGEIFMNCADVSIA
jgi:hypothetical protein